MNRVQKLRKKAGLKATDAVEIYFESSTPAVLNAIATNRDLVISTLRVVPLPAAFMPPHSVPLGVEASTIGDAEVKVFVTRPTVSFDAEAIAALVSDPMVANGAQLFVAGLRYEKLASNGGKLAFTLNGQQVVLEEGKHFFLTPCEALKAKQLPDFAWVQ